MMTHARRNIGRAVGIAALTLIVAGTGYQNISAQGPGGGGPGGPGRGGPGGIIGPMMLDQLNLSSAQRDRVNQILDSHRDEQQALSTRGMGVHQALQDAITSGVVDERTIRGRAADAAAVDADAAVSQARIYAAIFQILTPDQQKQLQQMQADMKARQQQMQQNRRERGGPRP